ncbi:Efflux pump [Penicillium malachiteum]|uniref:Efflux pump n=1 Tax=Penicillium malachiteum TaxID=1324776 RepID=A0AAD6MVJ3_9EURO|nr:Efflux pump [Penicillium malachiteum]
MAATSDQLPLSREVSLDVEENGNHTTARDEKQESTEDRSNIVDLDGPDDPENPLNWSAKKKWTNGGLFAAMTFITPLASSMFAPGVEDVMIEFHSTSTIIASFVVSVYVLGYAVGPFVVAPMSELYGRVPVYHASNVLFVIFTIACAICTSMSQLIVFRFFSGVAGSTPITIGGGTFGDMFKVEERGAAIAIWSMGPLLGPVIGPVAGGFLAEKAGWRVFRLIVIAAGCLAIPMFIFLRETYPVVLLSQKAKRLRKETNNPHLKSALQLDLSPAELFKRAIFRPFKMLFRSPIVISLSIYVAFIYGILYLLFTTITSDFTDIYGFSQGTSGLAYLGIGVGMMVGLIAVGASSDAILKKLTVANNGVVKPEYRLPPMIVAMMILPSGLFLYGWTTYYQVQWMAPIVGTGLVGIGLIGGFIPVSTYLIDAFGIHSASALAANTVLRSLMGSLLPLAGTPMYEALGLGWGNTLLGFLAVAMIPIPILFWKYGERIRTSTRFSVKM